MAKHNFRVTKSSPAEQPLTCIDLFSGCGGLSLGLERAGFQPLLFSEINISAAETYIANRAGQHIFPVGDIYNLTDINLKLLKFHWDYCGIKDVDLVCGGPPCQGYSGIGHRRTFKLQKEEIPSNRLYLEMVRVIRAVKPKMFLFENVRGLLNSKWTHDGKNGEIFDEVLKSFVALNDYVVRWELVLAKDYGVPQNRPRVLMVGIRRDVLPDWVKGKDEAPLPTEPTGVKSGFIPKPEGTPPTMEELLSDLIDPKYGNIDATIHYPTEPRNAFQEMLRTSRDGHISGKGAPLTEQEYSNHSPSIREKFAYMIANNGEIPVKFQTKKFAQRVFPRVWGVDGPNITATSLPEDYVHFSQPRSPTVREWARIQTFPDWYIFKGSRTTGGRRRAGDPSIGVWTRDVPRYTQIGNAVPVLLAEKVGRHLAKLLRGESCPNQSQQLTEIHK